MADIALILQGGQPNADIGLSNGDLIINKDLQSAVIISLFSNRLAEVGDVPTGINRQGWWGDSYLTPGKYLIGSRLWLLQRANATQETANLAQNYCQEALRWLITEGVAASIDVQTQIVGLYTLEIAIQIYKPDSTIENFLYEYVWSQV